MSTRREILTGLFAALISILILGGSLVAANAEGRATIAQILSPTPSLTSVPTQIILVTPRPGEPTYTPSPTPLPSNTATSSVACPPPAGWNAIYVQGGDTLESLAEFYGTTPQALKQANCLIGNTLIPGTLLYVPGPPPPTDIPCGPPPGWVYYIVKPGDTLFSLAKAYGVSVADLQTANCMGSSTIIRAGQRLYVPNVVPVFPATVTPSPTVTQTPQPSATLTAIPPSFTPSSTTAAPTYTPTVTPLILTATPTGTPTVTATLPSPTPTATFTPLPPTATVTEWPTPTTPPTMTPYPTTAIP